MSKDRLEEIGEYEQLIKDGCTIQELLRGNSGNVGSIGELLIIAANYIDYLNYCIDYHRGGIDK